MNRINSTEIITVHIYYYITEVFYQLITAILPIHFDNLGSTSTHLRDRSEPECIPLLAVLGVMAYSVDPGTVNTDITRHIMQPIQSLTKTFSFLIKTPAEGAYTTVYCAVTPENQLLTGGHYKSVWKAAAGISGINRCLWRQGVVQTPADVSLKGAAC